MSLSEEKFHNNLLITKFKEEYLQEKSYYRHSDIDIFVKIVITDLLNYNLLLSDEVKNFFHENFINSHKYYSVIQAEKEKAFNNNEFDNSIFSFNIPEFEIYFIAKLFIDGTERKPECQTKLLFNSTNINQYISMRFKYKDLTTDSYIDLEVYSMEIKENNNLIGKTRIYLFDENMNLKQGRHIFKLIKNENSQNDSLKVINEDLLDLDDVEKEIDFLINNISFDDKKVPEKILDNSDKNLNNYYYNPTIKKLIPKPTKIKNYENILNELLSKTNNSFVVIKFPSFQNKVIYEEDISEDYNPVFNPELPSTDENAIFKNWVNDPYINIFRKDFYNNKDNPISKKFSNLMRENDEDDDLYARDIRLNPMAMHQINKLLNTPDFIELDSNKVALFWTYRYELLKNNTPRALTKIMNSVKWGNSKSENEFIKNILNQWKTIEISDILFMLSRKFSVNNIYPNTISNSNTNFDLKGMKQLREFAVKELKEHSKEELNFILLQLVQAIRYEDISEEKINSPLVSFLIQACSKDSILASSFFWFIQCEADNDISSISNIKNKNINPENYKKIINIYQLIRQEFDKNIKENYPEINNLIENEKAFKDELVAISGLLTKVSKGENKIKELRNILNNKRKTIQQEYFLPIDPKIKIKGTVTDKCSVFKSAKYPCKYTFKVEKDSQQYNPHEEKEFMSIMFKFGDDLRQDQLILQIINFMDSLLKKAHLNYEFTTYKVLATSKSDGFVEFVPNSRTIFDILRKYNKVILSYFKDIASNNEKDLSKYLNSYINSCAGYCVVTYILGIGDRHLENLMIDNRGRLFHIDFGYILGKDPKPYPPAIKLSQEMVDVMGGKDSPKYEEFKQKCVNAYWVLRENARVIVNMFYLMIDSGIPELNDIENLKKLHEKFVPDFSKQEASNSFLTNLEESLNKLMPKIMESFHSLAQNFK